MTGALPQGPSGVLVSTGYIPNFKPRYFSPFPFSLIVLEPELCSSEQHCTLVLCLVPGSKVQSCWHHVHYGCFSFSRTLCLTHCITEMQQLPLMLIPPQLFQKVRMSAVKKVIQRLFISSYRSLLSSLSGSLWTNIAGIQD